MPKTPPLDARTEAEAGPMMTPQAVRERLGISAPSLNRMVRAGEFPPPLQLRPRLARWERAVVEAWLASKLN